ncbi:hypothetical protein C8F01DRAFT_1082093 [Mycena amicta]|nr:hypothetical protein C8F01DRAFT_1082093 [Mycena amicta]
MPITLLAIVVGPYLAVSIVYAVYSRWGPKRPALPGPKPLPTKRIDISLLPAANQPENSALLSLPLELRWCIYEQALGGRQIRLEIHDDLPNHRRVVRTKCYVYLRNERNMERVDGPIVALLLTCRQVYHEAQPILLAQNTFWLDPFKHSARAVFLASLGLFALPQLRSLGVEYHSFPHNRWFIHASLNLPSEMQALQSLTCLFHDNAEVYSPETHTATYNPCILLDSPWGHSVCEIKTLREFKLVFTFGGEVMDIEDKRWKELERKCVCSFSPSLVSILTVMQLDGSRRETEASL